MIQRAELLQHALDEVFEVAFAALRDQAFDVFDAGAGDLALHLAGFGVVAWVAVEIGELVYQEAVEGLRLVGDVDERGQSAHRIQLHNLTHSQLNMLILLDFGNILQPQTRQILFLLFLPRRSPTAHPIHNAPHLIPNLEIPNLPLGTHTHPDRLPTVHEVKVLESFLDDNLPALLVGVGVSGAAVVYVEAQFGVLERQLRVLEGQ